MPEVAELGTTPVPDSRGPSTRSLHRRPESFERLRSLIEGDLLPRLLLIHNAGPVPPGLVARAARVLPGGEYDRFLQLLLGRHSDDALEGFLTAFLEDGHPAEAVYVDLLAPAARELGVMWEEDSCNFAEVTLACCQMQRIIRRMTRRRAFETSDATRGRVLVEAPPDAQHTLGAIVVAEILSQTGWSVVLGQPFDPVPDVEGISLVAYSLARTDQWEAARDRIAAIRRLVPGVEVIVGGHAFLEQPALVSQVGADGWAEDGRALKAMTSGLCSPA